MAKKLFGIISGCIIAIMILSSCNSHLFVSDLAKTEDEIKKASEVGHQAIAYIQNGDIEGLKTIMSKRATETEDFAKGFEYSHELLAASDILSIEENGCYIGETIGVGAKKTGTHCFYLHMTNGTEYVFGFTYYFHAEDTSCEGLDHMDIIDSKEYTEDFKKIIRQYDSVHGIYNPDWLTEAENS